MLIYEYGNRISFSLWVKFIYCLHTDCGSLSERSEESGSHYGFFISDEDVNMAEEMPNSLQAYLEITESTYKKLHPSPQSDSLSPDSETTVQLLNNWCRKLCSLLAEYTNVQSTDSLTDSTKTLLSFKKICPWRMSESHARMSSVLSDLCIRNHCCDSLSHYSITPVSDLTGALVQCTIDANDDSVLIKPLDSVFLSVFWFLVDDGRVLSLVQELSASEISRSQRLWQTLINCLLRKILCSWIYWKHFFAMSDYIMSI